jgi:thioredoxin reductase (NADPH)
MAIEVSEYRRVKTETERLLRKKDADVYDLIIVGAGVAGLSAALSAIRASLNILVIEQRVAGGQILDSEVIDNYLGLEKDLSGIDLARRMTDKLEALGLRIQWGKVVQIQPNTPYHHVLTDEGKMYRTRSVLLCTGADPKTLDLPGEKEFQGRGISYSAYCDASFYKNKKVAVVGGGNSALENAEYLSRFAKEITLIHHRNHFSAEKILINKAFQNSKINYLWNSTVRGFGGEGRVTNIKIFNHESEHESSIFIDGVFVYIGKKPNSELCGEFIKKDERGYIIVSDQQETSQKGIYAAGDVCAKSFRHLTLAMAEGGKAVYHIDRLLNG